MVLLMEQSKLPFDRKEDDQPRARGTEYADVLYSVNWAVKKVMMEKESSLPEAESLAKTTPRWVCYR
jgi:hypothetical protein